MSTPEQKALRYVVGALAVLVVVVVAIRVLSISELEKDSLCPTDTTQIPQGDLNILIDRTDALSDLSEDVARRLIAKWGDRAPPFERMHLYVLNHEDIKVFSRQLTVCAPPSELSLQFAKGRTEAQNLMTSHRARISEAITQGLVAPKAIHYSRILEALRQITNSTWPPKSKLIIITDLIEKSNLADFYTAMAPEFDVWKKSAKGAAILNEIMLTKENRVQICELQTDKPDHAHRGAARTFWQKLFYQYGIKVQASCSEMLL